MQQNKPKLRALVLKSVSYGDNRQGIIQNTLEKEGYEVTSFQVTDEAINFYNQQKQDIDLVVAALGVKQDRSDFYRNLVENIRKNNKRLDTFICIFSDTACKNPQRRMELFNEDLVNMVTCCFDSLKHISKQIIETKQKKGNFECQICNMKNLTEDGLWTHIPLYHCNLKDIKAYCTICKQNIDGIGWHFRNYHGPCGRGEVHSDLHSKSAKLYAFALVVVRRKSDGKYLVVQEFCNSGYWLPGGRCEVGESLKISAIRECKEEAGIDIDIKGILTMQFQHRDNARMRIIYYAEPVDESQLPKSIPDYESVGASYIDIKEINKIHLRGNEPVEWFNYVEQNKPIYPLEIFSKEG